ncbi:CBASS cGAMP-activated phospholipase [Lichenihabitans psoromatis]|uniref:CBASS cGAMP-activated phospholipase n=1 Tax=Lichenihabitans psoromatis TaxID=2528642 RepID=UPI001478D451|nr:CBASS cGAMP-activated phospholipase [Lichenihabitans psoromatis]
MTKPRQEPVRRILSIDGGGIVGTFPAAFLAALEKNLGGEPIGRYFDLIVGTSTGGIIAIGLALDMTAASLLSLYEKEGPTIFGQDRHPVLNRARRIWRNAKRLVTAKHPAEPLKEVLEATLGDRRIGEAKTRLAVPAWNPSLQKVYVYKTAHHPRFETDYKSRAVDAAMATAAAPTFFPRHVTRDEVGLIDGGVWANNPVGLAVVEAIGVLGWSRESLRVLSIGCLDQAYRIGDAPGITSLGSKAIKLFMDGQSHASLGTAFLLTGHEHEAERVFRVTHTVPYKSFAMDDTTKIGELKGMGFAMARDRIPTLRKHFFGGPAEPFEPYHRLKTEMEIAK